MSVFLSVPASEHSAHQRPATRGHQDRRFRSVPSGGQQVRSAWDLGNSRVRRWVSQVLSASGFFCFFFNLQRWVKVRRKVQIKTGVLDWSIKPHLIYLKACAWDRLEICHSVLLEKKASSKRYEMIGDKTKIPNFLVQLAETSFDLVF